MTIVEGTKAFKTKLKVNKKDNPHQWEYLMKTANACIKVRNWYVSEALKRMKEDGVTVFTPKEELKKYSPRELRKVLTTLVNSDPEFVYLKGIPSTARTYVFEQIEKTYSGGKGKKYNFVSQCKFMAENIEKRIEKLKEKAAKEGRVLTEEEIEKERVFFNNKKACKPDELYKVKGFPRYIQRTRHLSFPIDNVVVDSKNNCVTLPPSLGNKKFNVPKMESVKIYYYNHDFNSEGIDRSAIFTISFDGQDWWMSVKQKAYSAVGASEKRAKVLGLDVGIKNTAVLSNGQVISNMADNKALKKLESKKIFLDQKRKRNFEKSSLGTFTTPFGKEKKIKSAKYRKLTKHIEALDNKIMYYKDTLLKQQVASVDLNGVKGLVIEDFEVESQKHNKKWSGKVQRQCMGKFRQMLITRAKFLGIEVKEAPKVYPSTQICSHCGERNMHMRKNLKERTFKCEFCGHTLDRDLNASINLANLWDNKDPNIKLKTI